MKILLTLLIFLCIACGKNKLGSKDFYQATHRGITLQVMPLTESLDTTVMAYKVRLLLDKNKSADNYDYWYKRDSSFFILAEGKKIYPNLLEPVANGVTDSYEYLLLFEKQPLRHKTNLSLIYTDYSSDHVQLNLRLN